ncbi:lysozyme [Clostridium neonatale]|uniref:lysozyme n=1 Tax=Clostridium neonatale TaxID=137838 RepID=UPI00291B905C|nr:glycoside hydrolase family protein [Clostridium neonatale]CAI3202378.1 lysozyme [Clostridium neonatale]CAI3211171.1 lysozyme [Clostridium neonatale]
MSEAKNSTNIKNGWFKEDDQWYYYEDNKKLNTQWIQSKGRYYYLEKDGHMVKGWFQTSKNNNWYYAFPKETVNNNKTFYEGELCTGWLKIDDKWYFFEDVNEDNLGAMYYDGIFKIKDKYYKFDKEGVWLEEIKNIQNKKESNEIISDELCDFIAYFEGCRLTTYYCSSGILTIGIGCTRKEVTSLGTITKERAYEELRKDILIYVKGVDTLCSKYNISLNKYEREALISFAFNCGATALEKSTLWYNITKGIKDTDIIRENFFRFVKSSSGEVLDGLIRRRKAEIELFLNSTYIN